MKWKVPKKKWLIFSEAQPVMIPQNLFFVYTRAFVYEYPFLFYVYKN